MLVPVVVRRDSGREILRFLLWEGGVEEPVTRLLSRTEVADSSDYQFTL